MVPNIIYEFGENLGLNKKEIDDIISYSSSQQSSPVNNSSPVDVYKAGTDYGTISIKDF